MYHRRLSYSITLARIRISMIIIIYIVLVCYGYSKTQDVLSRFIVTQSTDQTSVEDSLVTMEYIICLPYGSKISCSDRHGNTTNTTNYYPDSLCGLNRFMAILDFEYPVSLWCQVVYPGNISETMSVASTIPYAYINENPVAIDHNVSRTTPIGSVYGFSIDISKNRKIRSDSWGLIGKYNAPYYDMAIGSDFEGPIVDTNDTNSTSLSILSINYRGVTSVSREFLVTSIQSAVADMGGAFTALWGIFYLFFGSARLNPFGIFTLLCYRRKTRNKLNTFYGFSSPNLASVRQYKNVAPDVTTTSFISLTSVEVNQDDMPTSSSLNDLPAVTMDLSADRLSEITDKLTQQETELNSMKALMRDLYLDMDLLEEPDPTKKSWYENIAQKFKSVCSRGKGDQ